MHKRFLQGLEGARRSRPGGPFEGIKTIKVNIVSLLTCLLFQGSLGDFLKCGILLQARIPRVRLGEKLPDKPTITNLLDGQRITEITLCFICP
jgi:hypothetical protein